MNEDLIAPAGEIPARDKKTFETCLQAIIDTWQLKRPVDIMVANRMVCAWMKLRYIEKKIDEYGLFFEDKNDQGKVNNIRMNQLAYFLKQVEGDFRSYYRILQGKNQVISEEQPKDISSWLLEIKNGKSKKRTARSRKVVEGS